MGDGDAVRTPPQIRRGRPRSCSSVDCRTLVSKGEVNLEGKIDTDASAGHVEKTRATLRKALLRSPLTEFWQAPRMRQEPSLIRSNRLVICSVYVIKLIANVPQMSGGGYSRG